MNTEDHIQDMAKEAIGNWKKFESFGWHNQPDDAEEWCIVYVSNRDSDLLTESNAAAIAEAMAPHLEGEDCTEEHHGHWAVGHVDGYAIRVYKPEPTTSEGRIAARARNDGRERDVTEAFRTWAELKLQVDAYPVLDEEDFSRREYEATLENIESAGRRFVRDDAPEDWTSQCFSWFWEHDQGAVEARDGGGGYPDDSQIKEALEALGFAEAEETEEA